MLKTKLHRPILTAEHVFRYRLIDELNRNMYKPLTLICAPAGYGKSMLASSWIEESNTQYVWLSLSEGDNDLRDFLTYIVEGIRQVFPEKLSKTKSIIKATDVASSELLVHTFINELDQIEEPFIVIFDDYHLIHATDINKMMDEWLKYPPQSIHLCLLTRRDPALRINNLRAHNRMTEIRMDDLAFLQEEISSLFHKIHGIELTGPTTVSLKEKTEGWVTALRMISLASKNNPEIERSLSTFKGDLNSLTDFLSEEILSGLSDEMEDLLLYTALMNNFCFDLIKACYFESSNPSLKESSLIKLFDELVLSDLFLISLDNERKWYRYHHLFQNILTKKLNKYFDSERLKRKYLAAANWYEKEGFIDEALNYLFLADENEKAGKFITKYAHLEFLNGVGKVGSWLHKTPSKIIESNPSLLMLTAWHAFGQFQIEVIPPILEKVKHLIKDIEPDSQTICEINFFDGNLQYWMGETNQSIDTLSKALKISDNQPTHIKCNIELVYYMAMQRKGVYDDLVREITSKIKHSDKLNEFDLAYLYGSVAFVHLLSGKLQPALDVSSQMQIYAKNNDADFLLKWSYYLQALIEFNLFELDKALYHFEIIEDKYLIVDTRAVFDSMAAAALIHQLNKNDLVAERNISNAVAFAHQIGDLINLEVVRSSQARIALLKGDLDKAVEWANTFFGEPNFADMFFWLEVPLITKSKILISVDTKQSLKEAEEILNELYEIAFSSYLGVQLIEINILQSLVLFKTNRKQEGMEKLKIALLQAEDQNFLRPFIEMGNLLLQPLTKVKEENKSVAFIDKITHLILKRRSLQSNGSNKDKLKRSVQLEGDHVSLTNREKETLLLLAQGLRNKEIANKIYVSEGTVKKHVYNMGQKFNTNTRVELLNKAREMGFIESE